MPVWTLCIGSIRWHRRKAVAEFFLAFDEVISTNHKSMEIDAMSTESTVAAIAQLRALWATESTDRFCTHSLPSFLHKMYFNANETQCIDSEITHFLNAIQSLCALEKTSHSDAKTTSNDSKKNDNAYCGYIFQKNDLAFNCKTCQTDETCVICFNCYENSDHAGHEIYFHTTLPGGMCDCGDAEAWKPTGFCTTHSQESFVDENAKERYTLSSLSIAMGTHVKSPRNYTEEWLSTSSVLSVRSLDTCEWQLVTHLFANLIEIVGLLAVQIAGSFEIPSVTIQGRKDLEHYWSTCGRHVQANERNLAKIFHLRISNDDIHSDNELVHSLIEKRIHSARQLTNTIDTQGSTIVRSNMTLYEATELMQAFQAEGWHVSIISERHLAQEKMILNVLKWLQKCVENETYQIVFCQQLFLTNNCSPPLKVWLSSDPFYRKELALELYDLYLKLQTEKAIKVAFSWGFMSVYEPLMIRYISGIGTQRESIFQYGVQLFTTPSIVTAIHHPNTFDILKLLLNLLLSAIESAKVCVSEVSSSIPFTCDDSRSIDCGHFVLRYSRCTYLMDHLGYVLHIPSMAHEMLSRDDILDLWFSFLRQTQHLDAQKWIDETQAHVTFESQKWHAAFSFQTQIHRLCVTLCRSLCTNHSTSSVDIPKVFECIWKHMYASQSIMRFIRSHWENKTSSVFTLEPKSMVQYDMLGSSVPVSFHYPLHTMFGLFLRQLESTECRQKLLSTSLPCDLQNTIDAKQLVSALFEFPLRTLIFSAHIQSGLWVRNGQIMSQQLLYYTNLPWCCSFRDIDVFLIQMAVTTTEKDVFLSMFFNRFGLTDVVENLVNPQTDVPDATCARFGRDRIITLLENALQTLLWIITQSVVSTCSSDCILRRELVHRLAVEPRTRSQLFDKTLLPHLESLHVDAILNDIGVPIPTRDIAEPCRYTLKKNVWRNEYDPIFFHISRAGHEKAQLNRYEAIFREWKLNDAPIPLISNLEHESFSELYDVTLDANLIGILRALLEIAFHKACGHTDTENRLCSDAVLTYVLHLLNVAVLRIRRTECRETVKYFRFGPKEFAFVDAKSVKRQRVSQHIVETVDVHEASLLALLHRYSHFLCDDFQAHKVTISVMKWLLTTLKELDPYCRLFLESHEEHTSMCPPSCKKELQKRIQQNAIDAMRSRQQAFTESNTFAALESTVKVALDEEDSPDCIICSQCKPHASIMYIGHMQPSRVATHTSMECGDAKSFDVFISLCGHAVHLICWKEYMTSVRPQRTLRVEEDRLAMNVNANIAFDAFASEFLCPMCQSLSSLLIPFVPPRASDRKAMEKVLSLRENTFHVRQWLARDLLQSVRETPRRIDVHKEAMESFGRSFVPLETAKDVEPLDMCRHMWQAVASTWTLLQLHGVSMATYPFNSMETQLSHLQISDNTTEKALGIALSPFSDQQLDPCTPRDDAKANQLLRALSSAHILFENAEISCSHFVSFLNVLQPHAKKPLFENDLFLLTVAICGSMLFEKAHVLRTIRSFAVLCMAQTALQIARWEHQMDTENVSTDEDAVDILIQRLCVAADIPFARKTPFRRHLFVCNMSRHLRQMTMLCRAIFRGIDDPDAREYANFVSSLRLTSDLHQLSVQLGIPSVQAVIDDVELMDLLQAHASNGMNGLRSLPIRTIPRVEYATITMIPLPASFVTLYARIMRKTPCPSTLDVMENPAICMICGTIVCGGTDCCRQNGKGACTRHAANCGEGVGCFFLVRSTWTLLLDNARSCYFPSVYVDAFGEDDVYLRRGRPLHLSNRRRTALLRLYGSHQIRHFVSRDRQTSEQFIRSNYF